jgi:hypothetical protein
MKRITLVSLYVLVAMLVTIGSAAASQSKTVYTARLVEEGTGSLAHGNAVFVFSNDGTQVRYKLVVNGLNNTTQGHIHVAPAPGSNGPVVLWLYPDEPPFVPTLLPGIFNGVLGTRTATASDLTGAAGIATFEDLRAAIAEGRAYVNVHTSAFPAGEIRGDIH